MSMPDTRPDFRQAAEWASSVIGRVTPSQMTDPTPCDEWNVRDLLGHMTAVLERVGSIGQGADPFATPGMLSGVADDEWPARFGKVLARWEEIWSDDGLLTASISAPFGTMPGAQVLGTYVAEFLVHGWDLAQATGQDSEAPADLATRALEMSRIALPAEERGEGAPFGPPVKPSKDAGPTERLARWLARR